MTSDYRPNWVLPALPLGPAIGSYPSHPQEKLDRISALSVFEFKPHELPEPGCRTPAQTPVQDEPQPAPFKGGDDLVRCRVTTYRIAKSAQPDADGWKTEPPSEPGWYIADVPAHGPSGHWMSWWDGSSWRGICLPGNSTMHKESMKSDGLRVTLVWLRPCTPEEVGS